MKNILFYFLISLVLTTCSDDKVVNGDSNIDSSHLKFSSELAYSYIEKQVSFGPRNPGSEGHKKCSEWLLETLKAKCDKAYFQEFQAITYDGNKFDSRNIIGKINPEATRRILLSAHWDTRHIADQDTKNQNSPILGANDAASGVGVILALLDSIDRNDLQLGIDIVFFDIEDYGQPQNSTQLPMEHSWCLGSQYYAKNYNEPIKPVWGILLDMVGGENATFLKEELSRLYAPNLVNTIWSNAEKLGFGEYFVDQFSGMITDDHLYLNTIASIPTIDIIHYNDKHGGFADYWHTHEDNMNSVNKNTLNAVGKVVEHTIIEENRRAIQ